MSNCGMCQGLSFGKKSWFEKSWSEKSGKFLRRKSKKFPSLTRFKRRHNKSPLRSPLRSSPLKSPLRSSPLKSPLRSSPLKSPLRSSPLKSPLRSSPIKTRKLARMSRPFKRLSKHLPSRHSLRNRMARFKRRRSFGSEMGPGYIGQTSYPNAYAPYFGSSQPFVNAPNWWYPVTDGVAQSPGMLSLKP